MPIKLILTLILVAFVAVFTGFNLDNSCDIWLFHTFKDVPVFLTILISLVCGVVITLPFTLGKRVKQVEQEEKQKKLRKMEREEKKAQKEARKAQKKSASKSSAPESQEATASAEQSASFTVSPAEAVASASTVDAACDPESAQ